MAYLSSLPNPLVAGASENVDDVTANLNALRNAVNAVDASQIVAGSVGVAELANTIYQRLIPLGTILDWYPPAAAVAPFTSSLPAGFVACTGQAWSSVPNELGYTTGNLPNLVDKYAIGADPTFARGLAATHNILGGAQTATGLGGLAGQNKGVNYLPEHTHQLDQHVHTQADHTHNLTVKAQNGVQLVAGVDYNASGYPITRAASAGTAHTHRIGESTSVLIEFDSETQGVAGAAVDTAVAKRASGTTIGSQALTTNGTGAATTVTAVAAIGAVTVNVGSTVGFTVAAVGSPVNAVVSGQTITYTGQTATTLTGVTGVTVALAVGAIVTQRWPYALQTTEIYERRPASVGVLKIMKVTSA